MELARKMEGLKWQNKELEVTTDIHIHAHPHSKFKLHLNSMNGWHHMLLSRNDNILG